jgi:hypothetical protein
LEIRYQLTHAFHPNADPLCNAYCLRALIDCLVEINLGYIKYCYTHGKRLAPLYDSGVRYKRTVVWEPIPELYLPNKHKSNRPPFWEPIGITGGKQGGDCKSLASALIAQYRTSGKEANPTFRWARRSDNSGALDFHILVQTAEGFEDPSRVLGMSAAEVSRYFEGGE